MMKYIGILLLCILCFSSCVSDEEKRLQTDQSFEGEEIFNLSYSLGEHVIYALQPFEYYSDTANHSFITGCPLVAFNEFAKEVVLTFGKGECATNKPLRSGKIILTYLSNSTLNEDEQVRISYDEYWVKEIKLDGMRFLGQADSTSSSISWMDSLNNYKITDANNSTSKINGIFTHEVHYVADSIQYFTTTGSGAGRNLAGRSFTMEINQSKNYDGNCIRSGFFVAESGEESWTIERTVGLDVNHSIVYQQAEDCNHSANLLLSNGNELVKTQ